MKLSPTEIYKGEIFFFTGGAGYIEKVAFSTAQQPLVEFYNAAG